MSKKVIQKTVAPVDEEKVTTKLFMNGGSKSVRIPAKWKFDTDTVELTYNPEARTVTISNQTREEAKAALIDLIRSLSPEEREEIKNWAIPRDVSIPSVRPEVAEFFREEK